MQCIRSPFWFFIRLSVMVVGWIAMLYGGAWIASAEGSCTIRTSPDTALEEYLKGIDSIVTALISEGTKGNCSDGKDDSKRTGSSDIQRGTSRMIGAVNRSVTSENLFTSFRFTTDLIRRVDSNGMVAVRRDHALLVAKQKRIETAYDAVYARCGWDRLLETNVSPFPDTDTTNQAVGDMLDEVLSDHIEITKLFREAAIGNPPTVEELTFVPKDSKSFIRAIQNAYGPEAIESCGTEEGGLFDKVKKAIDRIGNLGGGIEKGTNEWKNAWKLLNGNEKERAQMERSLLSTELSRQWLSDAQSTRTLQNLNDYNEGKGWQGVQSSLASVGDSAVRAGEAVQKLYSEAKEVLGKSKNTDEYLERLDSLETLKSDIGKELIAEKEQVLALIGEDTAVADDTLWPLIEMHVTLSKTLKNIAPAEQTSKEACNGQMTGVGNCRGQ